MTEQIYSTNTRYKHFIDDFFQNRSFKPRYSAPEPAQIGGDQKVVVFTIPYFNPGRLHPGVFQAWSRLPLENLSVQRKVEE